MRKVDPHDAIFHEITFEDFCCFEYIFPEAVFHRSDVGLHVIFHRSKEDRIDYTAWCYITSEPLMRLVGVASLEFDDPSLKAVNQLVVNHIVNAETLPAKCRKFIDWIDRADDLNQLKGNPHGSETVEKYDCFELKVPGCVFDRSDIKLQVVCRSTTQKTKFDIWCHLDHYPLLGYVGYGELSKKSENLAQDIVNQITSNDNNFQEIAEFLHLLDTIEL